MAATGFKRTPLCLIVRHHEHKTQRSSQLSQAEHSLCCSERLCVVSGLSCRWGEPDAVSAVLEWEVRLWVGGVRTHGAPGTEMPAGAARWAPGLGVADGLRASWRPSQLLCVN